MSSEAPAAAVAAPVAADSVNSVAPSAPQAQFDSDILGKKDATATDPAIEQQSAQPEANAASEHTSEQDAAAVAAAVAAAAAAADASSAAQTIAELATAATNAANTASDQQHTDTANGSTDASTADATDKPEATTGDAEPNAEAQADAQQQQQQDADAAAEESFSGLPRNVESELREIYSVSSAIANFCVAHVNQVNVPTPQKVRNIIQKALKLTSSLSMLLAQPEVALRQLDADEHGKRPAESKLDSARKRQRSSDWDGNKVGAGGFPMAPYTPNSGMRVFPDGSLPTSFPSPGMDGDMKGPQYKKRSRAPAPGSCQACGTGETPEWRRGPDGARTLCNACGLHYAKLVRKRMQQEGGEEPSPSQAPPQVSLVSLEELRASTKSAEAAAAAGLTPSASSSSLNGTPLKGNKSEAWNTPSKPPRVPSSLGGANVIAPQLEQERGQEGAEANNNQVPPPPAPVGEQSQQQQQQTAGIVEPAPTPATQEAPAEPVIAPELAGEAGGINEERPMETDQ
ncbi:hypothetical protein NDA16_003860 [Ustilago loliicola]|nr:hypothetical protein NDA16_003860 [Ustilago loliicola]